MHEVLFLVPRESASSLGEVAGKVFEALDLSDHEERESSNYPPDEHYFVGYAANASIKVCDSDRSKMPEYPYWLVVSNPASRKKAPSVLKPEPESLAARLANAGFKVFIPSQGWGSVGWVPSGQTFEPQL
jgi:hypothetical protein